MKKQTPLPMRNLTEVLDELESIVLIQGVSMSEVDNPVPAGKEGEKIIETRRKEVNERNVKIKLLRWVLGEDQK